MSCWRCSDPFPAERMRAYPVSTKVNSVKNDEPSLIEGGRAERRLMFDPLTGFGLFAVTAMLVAYALEHRGRGDDVLAL
jgi:hypothetical protein